jgi:hypothetical protein
MIGSKKPKFLDQVRQVIRVKYYSLELKTFILIGLIGKTNENI